MVSPCGLIVIDTSAAGVTVSTVGLLTPPNSAVIVVEPSPALVASPRLPGVLLITATAVREELQVTVEVRSCVDPSVNFPVAVSC